MKIVIDIDKDYYNAIKAIPNESSTLDMLLIKNGTPLPEHHGRLIDEKDLSLLTVHLIDGMFICDAPTIIEADKGVLEKINEKQDSLRATCKAWDEAISRDGYVD